MSDNINLLKLLSTKGFIQYSKAIAKEIGVHEAITLGELCSVANMFNFEEFYFSQQELADDTGLSVKQIRGAVVSLEKNNIVSVQRKGIPCKNWYILNADAIAKILTREVKTDQPDTPNLPNSTGKNCTAVQAKTLQHLKKDITIDINNRYNYLKKYFQKDESFEKNSEIISCEILKQQTNLSENSENLFLSKKNNLNEQEEFSETTLLDEPKTKNLVSETKSSSQRTSKERKPLPKERKATGSFPADAYNQVIAAYKANRSLLFKKNLLTHEDYELNIPQARSCIKKAFTAYGVDKVIDAMKDSLHIGWLYQYGNDYNFFTIFSAKVMADLINKSFKMSEQTQQQTYFPKKNTTQVVKPIADWTSFDENNFLSGI